MRRFVACVMVLCLSLLGLAGALCEANRYDEVFDASLDAGRFTVRFLSLLSADREKSGDSTILTSPDGKVMLLDAGEPDCVDQVIDALNALGITKIDYLVASHPHIDHIGGFEKILKSFEVKSVYTSYVEYPKTYVAAYEAEIARQGIPHVYLSEGDTFQFGEAITVEVFHPGKEITYFEGFPENSTQFINDLSLLLRFAYQDSSMIFGGDLYTTIERDIVSKYGDRLQSDVFKVGHHGAATSSSKPYREAINPKIAVMVSHTLSDLGVYQKLRKQDIDTYITYFDGNISVSTSGNGTYQVVTQKDRATDFLN